jgi:hypothetical protein
MIEVEPGVYVGTESDCRPGSQEWSVVHACKHPCHRNAVGYTTRISPNHPNYLVLKTEFDLFLNIIEPDQPLFMLPLFTETLNFTREHMQQNRKLLFHCNQGESRPPALAMLHLAKYLGVIEASTYDLAVSDFLPRYPMFRPGLGIQIYMRQHWNEF